MVSPRVARRLLKRVVDEVGYFSDVQARALVRSKYDFRFDPAALRLKS